MSSSRGEPDECGGMWYARSRESRCLWPSTVRPHPPHSRMQIAPPAAVRRRGDHYPTIRRRSGSNRGYRLAAGGQRCGIPPALRSGAARGDHRTRAGVTIGTDGQGSHGGHARDARPRGGQSGQMTVSRTGHGRASGPRPHSSQWQTRKLASADGVQLELGARGCGHGSVSVWQVSKKSRLRCCAEWTTPLAVPTDCALRGQVRMHRDATPCTKGSRIVVGVNRCQRFANSITA